MPDHRAGQRKAKTLRSAGFQFGCRLLHKGREEFGKALCDLLCHQWRHCVADLDELLRPVAFEQIVVRKGLQSRGFPHSQATALAQVRVNEVVPVLRDVAGDCGGRPPPKLNAEPVDELPTLPNVVLLHEQFRERNRLRRSLEHVCECCRKGVARKVRPHMPSGFMVGQGFQFWINQPIGKFVISRSG